ncbi:Short chain dehydrogenase-like protein 23 [Elsinoe fawcettii]|nr:Short chain dehydrogenase-like protein 23 [Elsinoe fawcettii]
MSSPKVIVITGANRGIGLAIAERLLNQSFPVHLYACSRSGARLDLTPSSTSSKLHFATLDISSPQSISALRDTISSTENHLDILINNAGTNDTGNTGVPATDVVNVNYHGTKNVCLAFLPLLEKSTQSGGGRIVNVSSTGSALHHYSDTIKSTFRSSSLTLPELDKLADTFTSAADKGQTKQEGFGGANGYSFSKAAINALTAILGREHKGVTVNCCCPGWVDTEMGNIMGKPSKTPEEGARIPVRLAVGDLGGVSGRYWGNDGVSDKGEGRVQEW